jgi:hypothetical protein
VVSVLELTEARKHLTRAGVLGTQAYINYFQVGGGNYKQVLRCRRFSLVNALANRSRGVLPVPCPSDRSLELSRLVSSPTNTLVSQLSSSHLLSGS